jgi:PEP-CTERM motif
VKSKTLKNPEISEEKMKSLRSLFLLPLTIVAFLVAGTAANADPLSITLDSPYQNVGPGQTVTFTATITNLDPTDTMYLNGDSFNLDAPLSLDDSGFWNNSPFSLDPSSSSGDIELFTVSAPFDAVGLYSGSFEILGGDPSDFTDVVGSATFNVNVTPEPSSLLLLGSGLMGLATTVRRRRAQQRAQRA